MRLANGITTGANSLTLTKLGLRTIKVKVDVETLEEFGDGILEHIRFLFGMNVTHT